jgi:23S rRNA (uracil1939-C5)-methyltransferase
VTVVATQAKLPAREELVEAILRECPETRSIILNVNCSRGNTVLSGSFNTLWGEPCISDSLRGLTFKLSPRSFFQINPPQAERLYGKAIEYAGLTGGETVLDLYCGTGTITLAMASGAKKVIGAEIVPEAIEDAVYNARKNGIENAEFICADASEAALRLAMHGLRPDVITVDPPRKGLAPAVIDAIADMAPSRVVYVSCDPATLARDLKIFREKGYPPIKAAAVDMFPCTPHVETVVLMSRVKE